MLALVTRAEKDTRRISELFFTRKLNVLNVPLFSVSYHKNVKIDLKHTQSIIFSSPNGVRAFSKLTKKRTVKVHVVGDRTFNVAKRHGFKNVSNARGNAADLCDLVSRELNPKNGKLYYAAGRIQSGRIKQTLEAKGFNVERGILYEILAKRYLPNKIKHALIKKKIHFALFFSPRTANILVKLVVKNNLNSYFSNTDAFVLSHSIKRAISTISWRSVTVAKKPNLQSMLYVIDSKIEERKKK